MYWLHCGCNTFVSHCSCKAHRYVKTFYKNEEFWVYVYVKCWSPPLRKSSTQKRKPRSRLSQNRNLDVKHSCVPISNRREEFKKIAPCPDLGLDSSSSSSTADSSHASTVLYGPSSLECLELDWNKKRFATWSHIPSESMPSELEPRKEVRSKGLVIPDVNEGLTVFVRSFQEGSKTEYNAHLVPNYRKTWYLSPFVG